MGKLAVVGHDDVRQWFYVFVYPFRFTVAVLQTLLFNSKIKCKMETVLMIIAVLSLVAFVVGMFNPKTVKCSSRSKAALIYLSIFLVCGIVGTSISDKPELTAKTETTEQTEEHAKETPKEVKILAKEDVLSFPYSNGNVEIVFKNIEVYRIPNNGINLVLTLRIKNNSNEEFFIGDAKWKLLDSDKVEVEESGIYEPMFEGFTPGMFFFTVVEPNIGKEEKVGYSVKAETYYLSVNGHIVAKIPLDAHKK
jgi:hypothetical protein